LKATSPENKKNQNSRLPPLRPLSCRYQQEE
jgi:hypothetical protein